MNRKGVTLIELMIALVISATIVAAIYRIFLTQQNTYTVQDDVVDMQQNVRVAVNEMMREIRMAGFGNIQSMLPVTINGDTYNNVINPDTPSAGALTIVAGLGGSATLKGFAPPNKITVSSLSADSKLLFDTGNRQFISIAGSECFAITAIAGNTLTLGGNVNTAFKTNPNEPDLTKNVTVPVSVYAIRAITYLVLPNASGAPVLRRNGNLGAGNVSLADDIENVAFQYLDGNGNPTATPADVRTVRVTVTARTKSEDAKLKAGAADGYRRRQVASNILLRNMGL